MKIKHILAALALSLPGLVAAIPADPRPRTITNPDGSSVVVRVHGNEFFHFMSDADCTRILERDARGFITDAVRQGTPLAFSKQNIEMLQSEAEARFAAIQAPSSRSAMKKMGTLNAEGRTTYPTIGKSSRSLIVLVEFPDVEFTVENPKEYFTRQLNEPGFSDYGGQGSALDYYLDASNGLYSPQFDVVGPVKVSKVASYFKQLDSDSMEVLIRESLSQLQKNGEVDFSNYDLDEDGVIDTVFFYYAGYGSADSDTETIWPHQYDYRYFNFNLASLKLDGKYVGPYACANELKGINPVTGKEPWKDNSEPWLEGIGSFVHEYGHVLGLPDLYDVDYNPGIVVDTPGQWDVMDQGCYNFNGCVPPLYSAYEQWVCRWLEYTEAEDLTHYDLKALSHTDNPTAIRIRIPASEDGQSFLSEYFVIEARDKSKWDACFPNSGLLVWRINYTKNNWVNNSVNSKYGSNVKIIYANNQNNPIFTEGSIYEGSNVKLETVRERPFWKHPVITGIGYDSESMVGSFDYNIAKPSDAFTLLHDTPEAAADGTRAFRLTWDPVDGVDNYLVTVRIQNSGRIIGDFDAKNVGADTSVWVSGLSSTYWKFTLEAFVQCVVDGMPSTALSNVVTFKPAELPRENTAVDGIDADSVYVAGGEGCIYAPDGAQVYDMAGKLLTKDHLAPGIYAVVYAGRSWKVLVR